MPKRFQDEFPYGSLDFPGRTTLHPKEIAERVGVSNQHVLDFIEEDIIAPVLDVTGRNNKSGRKHYRVPIEAYRNFIVKRISGDARAQFLRDLPDPTLKELFKDIELILQMRGLINHQPSQL